MESMLNEYTRTEWEYNCFWTKSIPNYKEVNSMLAEFGDAGWKIVGQSWNERDARLMFTFMRPKIK